MSAFVYSLLKGGALAAKPFPFSFTVRPHYHILIQAAGAKFDIAVNIASEGSHHAGPNEVQDPHVLFKVKALVPANAGQLKALSEGIRNLSGPDIGQPDTDDAGNPIPGLDYVADGLVTRDAMPELPIFDPAHGQTGSEDIIDLINSGVNNPDAMFYVFGHRYDQLKPTNPAFHFHPDDGVHNIHMNQGNAPGRFDNENSRHEDGALLIHFSANDNWQAVFVAFQNQSFDNDADGFPN